MMGWIVFSTFKHDSDTAKVFGDLDESFVFFSCMVQLFPLKPSKAVVLLFCLVVLAALQWPDSIQNGPAPRLQRMAGQYARLSHFAVSLSSSLHNKFTLHLLFIYTYHSVDTDRWVTCMAVNLCMVMIHSHFEYLSPPDLIHITRYYCCSWFSGLTDICLLMHHSLCPMWLQVLMCGLCFLILFVGNFFTTVAVVRHKLKSRNEKSKNLWQIKINMSSQKLRHPLLCN